MRQQRRPARARSDCAKHRFPVVQAGNEARIQVKGLADMGVVPPRQAFLWRLQYQGDKLVEGVSVIAYGASAHRDARHRVELVHEAHTSVDLGPKEAAEVLVSNLWAAEGDAFHL